MLEIVVMTEKKRVHLLVVGLVQGVFYRAETKRTADKLGLQGWAKNLPNGSVEVYAVGPKDILEKLVDWCHHGPSLAKVEQVDIKWDADLGPCDTFSIIE